MTLQPDECSICLEPFLDKAKVNGCQHTFCYQCISTWSKTTNKCTLCAKPFKHIELVDTGNTNRKRTRSAGPPVITRVRSVQQRAEWDTDELLRLVSVAEEELGDDDDDDDDDEPRSQDEYELNDGLVVADDAEIEYEDSSTSLEGGEEDETSSGSVEIISPPPKRLK